MPSFSLRRRHDPFWDVDGAGARRSRNRHRAVAAVAFGLAWIVAAVAVLGWLRMIVAVPLPLGLDRLSSVAERIESIFQPTAALPVIVLLLVIPAGLLVSFRLVRLQLRGELAAA